jgi:phage baseplate assembly protein V
MIRDLAYRIEQLERRINNILRVGNIVEVDYDNALCRVEIGNIKTAWLKWFTDRASNDRSWWAPEVGEQVMVLSPSGEMAQGSVLPAIYQDAHPAPADRETVHRTEYADGSTVEYDRDAHRLLANLGASAIDMDRSRILLRSNGSTLEMDGAGIRLNGSRIDLN